MLVKFMVGCRKRVLLGRMWIEKEGGVVEVGDGVVSLVLVDGMVIVGESLEGRGSSVMEGGMGVNGVLDVGEGVVIGEGGGVKV